MTNKPTPYTLLRPDQVISTHKDWIIEGLLREGDLMIVHGQPKIGKSRLLREMSASISSGRTTLQYPTNKANILYISNVDRPELITSDLKTFGADLQYISLGYYVDEQQEQHAIKDIEIAKQVCIDQSTSQKLIDLLILDGFFNDANVDNIKKINDLMLWAHDNSISVIITTQNKVHNKFTAAYYQYDIEMHLYRTSQQWPPQTTTQRVQIAINGTGIKSRDMAMVDRETYIEYITGSDIISDLIYPYVPVGADNAMTNYKIALKFLEDEDNSKNIVTLNQIRWRLLHMSSEGRIKMIGKNKQFYREPEKGELIGENLDELS